MFVMFVYVVLFYYMCTIIVHVQLVVQFNDLLTVATLNLLVEPSCSYAASVLLCLYSLHL